IQRLLSSDNDAAVDAARYLCSGLCHQHVEVSSASLPVLPFLLERLDTADEVLEVEILDILLGFAIGVSRVRTRSYQLRFLGRTSVTAEPGWLTQLRTELNEQRSRLETYLCRDSSTLAEFARDILAELDEQPTDG
ncbi:MAG: hypothetical protein AAF078_10590, partial [Planctomycetota bacterium]